MPPHDRFWTLFILAQVLLAAIAAVAATLIYNAWLR